MNPLFDSSRRLSITKLFKLLVNELGIFIPQMGWFLRKPLEVRADIIFSDCSSVEHMFKS